MGRKMKKTEIVSILKNYSGSYGDPLHGGRVTIDDIIEALTESETMTHVNLTCKGCKYEKTSHDLCGVCCRGCGDMYEER
jgi:hypothetical protein